MVFNAALNPGPASTYISGRTCLSFESTSLQAATWSDAWTVDASYQTKVVDWHWTRSWGMDSCAGGAAVAYAYSEQYTGPDVSYGTSNADGGIYRDCADRHYYWNYGEMWARPPGEAWDWAGGGWWG